MATETRKRYKNFRDYVTPKVAEKSARLGGSLEESEFEEVEVVEIEGPDGESKRVTKDMVESFESVHQEMSDSAQTEDEEDEDE